MIKPRNYKRASLCEIQSAFEMRSLGKGFREISRSLNRSPSTIKSWLTGYRPENPRIWHSLSSDAKARFVFERMKVKKVLGKREPIRSIKIKEYVISKLEEGFSPEMISNTMEDEIGEKVCFKTIYNLTKRRRGLKKHLYEKGKPRRQKVVNRRIKKKEAAPNVISIIKRSEAGDKRQEFGHLEADLIIGKKGSTSCILSVIERLTRRKFFKKIPDRKSKTVLAYLIPILNQIPEEMLLSISLDNGPEFTPSTMHKLKERYSKIEVFHCEPYCSFQKGAVERANRDLRYFYPKKTDFDQVSKLEIRRIERVINQKPMKILGNENPLKIFEKLIALEEKIARQLRIAV